MDENNALSDAEMRLIAVNGQAIMLEGDFENVNMTNDFLNEMLSINNSKISIEDGCSEQLNENSCINPVKIINDEPTKLQLNIQGENNEVETVHIGIEEAKALGLFFYEVKNDSVDSWEPCTVSGPIVQTVEREINGHFEKVKLHTVPVNVNCFDKVQETLMSVNDLSKINESLLLAKGDKKGIQEENPESLPAIGHLEGFQIPTSEDGVLLPATVNARMADGSYQMITLVPQVVNGTVTYTVHFSGPGDKNIGNYLSNHRDIYYDSLSNRIHPSSKEVSISQINSVENFLHAVKNDQVRDSLTENVERNKTGIVNSSKSDNFSGSDVKAVQTQLPIDAKIDNLISENENVISKCKKVKYGKKLKSDDSETSALMANKVTKSNVTKTKKVKFKNKTVKILNDESEDKKLKMSLLKNGAEMRKEVTGMPHMNLNGRLEYPNLKAIDETASSFSYLRVKTSQPTKQPYFNVLPYPRDKIIPVQKQILPLNCDLQQAKNLISLQKFLETQKLELKIQPKVSSSNKTINIRPKPVLNEETKVVPDKEKISCEKIKEEEPQSVGDNEREKKSYKDTSNGSSVLLCDGNSENVVEGEKDINSTNKSNGIFIKNNPEYFSQRLKDGKADEHPLGSSENPIQLVQTGHTFHSRQPLSETQLRQIASILQKQKFDSPNVRKNSIFDPKTNTRIVYRVVYPEDVDLRDGDRTALDGAAKRKRGRHKTKSGMEDEIHKKQLSMPRGPGRPKKTPVSAAEEEAVEDEVEDAAPKKKIPRTRSGRLSRPPRYMVKDYRRLHNSDASEKTSSSNYDSDEAYAAYQNGKKEVLEPSENLNDMELESNLLPGLRPQPRSKRNFKPEYRCPTCQKIYLGHSRMMWHLNKFPDHCNVEKYKENYYRKRTETKARRAARRLNLCDVTNKVKQILNSMSKDELTALCGPILAEALTIWDFLLLRVNLLKESKKDEVDALLHELVILLEKLTKIAEDIFLPVFTKEAEKEEDCVEIDRMEVALALGLPVGFYKVNNDNLNLLRPPLKTLPGPKEMEADEKEIPKKTTVEGLLPEPEEKKILFREKSEPWEEDDEEKNAKKLEEPFWMEGKTEDSDGWPQPEGKTLSTKFEPNLSSKLLESSNDSMEDCKYEEPVIDLDSNSKDVEQSNSSGSPDMGLNKEKLPGDKVQKREEKNSVSELWNENSGDKMGGELWSEDSSRRKWDGNSDMVRPKNSSALWPGESAGESGKRTPNLWSENSNLTSSEKVDETNSEFLDSLLSVPNSNEFLTNGSEGFLSENMGLINEKSESLKEKEEETKEKREWGRVGGESNYWQKEENLLSVVPGVRTAGRLTSTPETNASVSFNIPNRRNSISDFSNISLEPGNLDMVLPPAKTLIKDCLKDDDRKFEIKTDVGGSFLESSEVKNWERGNSKTDFSSTNVNSEDLMKIALESLTSQHDVINVPASTFDSAMGILNQNQENGNLNLFTASETDGLDFNLPLPDHLLRSNFGPPNFQTTCASNFPTSESPAFLTTSNNIFTTTCTNSMDQFEANYSEDKKDKSLEEVMNFFETKNSFNGYANDNNSNFEFDTVQSTHRPEEQPEKQTKTRSSNFAFEAVQPSPQQIERPKKQTKVRVKQRQKNFRSPKRVKKNKETKKIVDYPKSNTIESIINEALFESSAPISKSLRKEESSPNSNSAIPNGTENYSLPIMPESLDEVENLDFLSQD